MGRAKNGREFIESCSILYTYIYTDCQFAETSKHIMKLCCDRMCAACAAGSTNMHTKQK